MRRTLHPWQLVVGLIAVCVATLGILYWMRQGAGATPRQMMEYLPAEGATVVYIDVAAMRTTGVLDLLAGAPQAQEDDYKKFVSETKFDYRSDLDAAAASFTGDEEFFLLRGRFHWGNLIDYVNRQGGTCGKGFCQMDGSRPERKISFYPVTKGLMALAVSKDNAAASRIKRGAAEVMGRLPEDAAWVSIPAAKLKGGEWLPERARPFAEALGEANRVVLTLKGEGGAMAVTLTVDCNGTSAATVLEAQLEEATAGLRGKIEAEHEAPDPKGLTGLLTAGTFQRDGSVVRGEWPVRREFLEALAGGGVN